MQLDNDILSTFFIDQKAVESLNQKVEDFGHSIVKKFETLGEWTHENSLMLNNFLQEKFLLSNLVKDSNRSIERLKHKLEGSEVSRQKLDETVTKLSILNMSLKNSLDEVVASLSKSREGVDAREVDLVLARIHTTVSLMDQ